MHISEPRQPSNTILTKCSKMTEEKHKRHGMNGNADGALKEDSPKAGYVQGGRLKFFKDGKFILELERAREGERVSWVSVPRKTFWPPQGTAASTPTYRQESSTSLSVSDDNSSIQSSPWQRDHSWKQPSPRRNQSKEMSFYFWRPKQHRRRGARRKPARRPYSTQQDEAEVVRISGAASCERTPKDGGGGGACAINSNNVNSSNSNSSNSKSQRRGGGGGGVSLLAVVQSLLDKMDKTAAVAVTTATAPPPPSAARAEVVVSPRKRFLREMEKDKVQVEDGCQKRSRNKTATTTATAASGNNSAVPAKVGSPSGGGGGGVVVNGTTEEVVKPTTRNCSYSITSLLAEDRNVKRSPSNSPSHFNTVTQPQYCSPSSEDRWYSESVDRLRSIELSQADKRGYPPYPHPSYLPHYMYPYSLPHYYGPGVYGRGYIVPPVYPAPPMPIAVRHDAPSCSWAVEPPRDSENRDDNITDMPLNLSKHAG